MAGVFLKSIQSAVQFGDVLRGKADRGGFSSNGVPQILDELDFLRNRELFQIFEGRFHNAIRSLDVSGKQIFKG